MRDEQLCEAIHTNPRDLRKLRWLRAGHSLVSSANAGKAPVLGMFSRRDGRPRLSSGAKPRSSRPSLAWDSVGRLPLRELHFRSRSPKACFMTWPPTSAIDVVSGIVFGQISTQFWA